MGISRDADEVSAVFEPPGDSSGDKLIEEFGVAREQIQAVLRFVAHSNEALAPDPDRVSFVGGVPALHPRTGTKVAAMIHNRQHASEAAFMARQRSLVVYICNRGIYA
jgi:hypothetical protein